MDQTTTERIRNLISQHQSAGIVVGKNPSVDSMAAALSLYLSLVASGKQAHIASPSDPLVEVSSLVGIDKVAKEFQGGGNTLVVSFPYHGDNIDKGSYTVENGFLNIIVKAGKAGLSFEDSDVRYRREGGGVPSLLFVVGTPRVSDLGPLFDPEAMKDTVIVNIDNKRENQGFGEVVLVSSEFSSISEQIVQLLRGLSLPFDIDIAQNLLAGIVAATSNLQDNAVSYQTFEVVAFLMKKGAVRKMQAKDAAPTRKNPFGFDDFDEDRPQAFPQRVQPQKHFDSSMSQQQKPMQPQQVRDEQHHGTMQRSDRQRGFQQQFPAKKQQSAVDDQQAPSDWLTPKIYKGSTNI